MGGGEQKEKVSRRQTHIDVRPCVHEEARSLTSSEFKDFPDEHEAGFSQGVSPAVALVAVVGEVAVVVSLLLSASMAHSRGRG